VLLSAIIYGFVFLTMPQCVSLWLHPDQPYSSLTFKVKQVKLCLAIPTHIIHNILILLKLY